MASSERAKQIILDVEHEVGRGWSKQSPFTAIELALANRCAALEAEREELWAATANAQHTAFDLQRRLDAVLALHHPDSKDPRYCDECWEWWTCPTVRAGRGRG